MRNSIVGLLLLAIITSCSDTTKKRMKLSLNGEWDIAKTSSFNEPPKEFTSKVPVPGLVDLASPAIDTSRKYDDGIYWHETTFVLDEIEHELIKLRIGKAKYHAKIYLNEKYVGEQVYCFSSATFDISRFLNPPGQENKLVIGVGTYNNVPDSIMWGHDFEKLKYIPGVYDDVELISAGYPYIDNIQIAPNIEDETVRIKTKIDFGEKKKKLKGFYEITELVSGELVAKGPVTSSDFMVELPGCKLWTPESPFLYKLKVSTQGDEKEVRFGMRSFSFDAKSKQALLNGKPYIMRGTNVCIFRFFEDPDRALLPWDDDWAIKLHNRLKFMHWNSIRYCIGTPPQRWYDIADSLGFLIHDEYPIWTGAELDKFDKLYPNLTPQRLANEYISWMSERWNHPCIVVWDAQNESVTKVTGEAINLVRDLDLSNRPWENGWSTPQAETDPMETHPYLFDKFSWKAKVPISERGVLADLLDTFRISHNGPNQWMKKTFENPIIINEYGWLWLNRDGSPTTLTQKIYDEVFDKNFTKEERIYTYCRYLGMITEYWRASRHCTGVLHFCGLGYSRPEEPRGQTSDHFIDIKNLTYEPLFVKYVKPSFAPVGLMIDFWDESVKAGEEIDMTVYVTNDMHDSWQGDLTFQMLKDDEVILSEVKKVTVSLLEQKQVKIKKKMPDETGNYRLVAGINLNGERIESIREFAIK